MIARVGSVESEGQNRERRAGADELFLDRSALGVLVKRIGTLPPPPRMEIEEIPRITLKDIADETGLSKATVCRALKNNPDVSEPTRQRVREAAERLHYRPDPALSALSKHRWAHLGLTRSKIGIAFINVSGKRGERMGGDRQELMEAFRRRAAGLEIITGYFDLREFGQPEKLAHVLRQRGFDGVILNVSQPSTPWSFPFESFAVVTVGYDHPTHRVHSITCDWAEAVEVAVDRIDQLKIERIGFAAFQHDNPRMDRQVVGAMLHTLRQRGSGQAALFSYGADDIGTEGLRERFAQWLSEEKPSVVVDGNAVLGSLIVDQKLRIPRDVGYCSILHASSDPGFPYSGVRQRYDLQGEWALEKVISLIELNRRGYSETPVRSTIACEWSGQGTLGGDRPRRSRKVRALAKTL